MSTSDLTFFEIDAKFGSSDDTCNVFVCESENGTWFYCCEGSEHVNESTIEPFDGCDLTSDTNDIDCFTIDAINSLSRFEAVMIDHLSVETVDRTTLTIEIDSINSAFQDENADSELVRILKKCIEKIEQSNFNNSKLLDVNGNVVGDFYFNIKSEEA